MFRRPLMTIGFTVLGLLFLALAGMTAWIVYIKSVERPAYKVVTSDRNFEIRDYPALVVAEIERQGQRRAAVSAGFGPLAAYIFAKNRQGDGIAMTAPVTQSAEQKIAMTAPVTQSPSAGQPDEDGSGKRWTIRFIMPSKYALADLPKPAQSDVVLRELPARRVAAIQFSGVATDKLLAARESELRGWMAKQRLQARGKPTFAYYDDPSMPWFLRRNEVMIDVGGAASGG